MHLLIIGAGRVGLEKLNAVLQNSPATQITIVGKEISAEIKKLADIYKNITLLEKPYESTNLTGADIIIAAVNDVELSSRVQADAKRMRILINVADKPAICDFYLSSIVQKGNLKIAISTNGKSPTIAKRIKEILHEAIPDEMDDLLQNIELYRQQLKGDFDDKVHQLNELTQILTAQKRNKITS